MKAGIKLSVSKASCISAAVLVVAVISYTARAQRDPPSGVSAPTSAASTPPQDFRRMKGLPESELTSEQKAAMEYYKSKRGTELKSGLFMDLLRVPVTMRAMLDLRLYVQQDISFGDALSEFAELIVLRKWNSRNEFSGHAGIAYKVGVKPEIIHAIAEGRYPPGMSADQAAIYHFTTELLENKNVSDPTYDALIKRFGERGVVDAMTLAILYSAVGMVYNTVREPVPPSWAPMPDFPQTAPVPLSEYADPRRFRGPGAQSFAIPPPRPPDPPPGPN